jgi:hemerythrin-like domain-containing protein
MDNKIDRNLLHQLNNEIKNTQVEDEKGRELLRDLENDIHALLERSEGNPVDLHPSIVQRLENALDHFEVTHPDLTMMISKVLSALSTAGI